MIRIASAAAIAALMSTAAMAQSMNPPANPAPTAPMAAAGTERNDAEPIGSAKIMTTLPSGATTVTNYYKQDVYDTADNKIGTVDDVLVDKTRQDRRRRWSASAASSAWARRTSPCRSKR